MLHLVQKRLVLSLKATEKGIKYELLFSFIVRQIQTGSWNGWLNFTGVAFIVPAHHVKCILGYTQLCFTVVKETLWTDGFSHRSYSRSIRRPLQRQIPQTSRFPVWLFCLTGVRFLKSQCHIFWILWCSLFLLELYQYFYWSSQRTQKHVLRKVLRFQEYMMLPWNPAVVSLSRLKVAEWCHTLKFSFFQPDLCPRSVVSVICI